MKKILFATLLVLFAISIHGQEQGEIQRWIEAFSHGDKNIRQQASLNLEKKGEEAVPFLIQALSNRNWMVRYYATLTLGKIGPKAKKAVQALGERLYDSDLRVRCHAARALAAQGKGASSIIPHLLKGMEDPDWRIRCYFAFALGKVGPDSAPALEALKKALGDPSAPVRKIAVQALGELKKPEAVPALLKAYEKAEGKAKEEILLVLVEMKSPACVKLLLEILAGPQKEMKAFAKAELLKMGNRALPVLWKILEQKNYSPTLKITALEVLALLPHPKKQTVQHLLNGLLNDQIDLRSSARTALDKIGPPAIPFLLENLDNKNGQIRQQAEETLKRWGASVISHIVRISAHSADGSIERAGSLYLKGQGIKTLPALLQALRDKDPKMRCFGAAQLGTFQQPSPLIFRALQQALKDKDKEVRKKALHSLSRLRPLFSPDIQGKIDEILKPAKKKKTPPKEKKKPEPKKEPVKKPEPKKGPEKEGNGQ